MLKPVLQVRLGQQLTMTPQLQQAIRLLQLSSLELKAEIQAAFESNPMLETEEDRETDTQLIETPQAETDTDDIQEVTVKNTFPDELPVDSQWDDVYEPIYSSTHQQTGDYSDYLENQGSAEYDSLQQHLWWQLELSSLSDLGPCGGRSTLIDALDGSGYLQETLENIHTRT